MSEKDEVILSTWERNFFRKACGSATGQEMQRIRTKQEPRGVARRMCKWFGNVIRMNQTTVATKIFENLVSDSKGGTVRVSEKRVLRRIFGPKRDQVIGGWRKLHSEEFHNLYSSPSIISQGG
jgi:hypothetical protein